MSEYVQMRVPVKVKTACDNYSQIKSLQDERITSGEAFEVLFEEPIKALDEKMKAMDEAASMLDSIRKDSIKAQEQVLKKIQL